MWRRAACPASSRPARGAAADGRRSGRRSHRLLDEHLLGRVRVVVGAAHDVGDVGVGVVDHDGEVVDRRSVGARDHEVVEQRVLERALAADHVVDDGGAFVGHAQPHGAGALVLAAEAAVAVRSLNAFTSSGPAVERYAWPPAISC